MRILFAIVDGGGNVPPQIAVAATLLQRGADVLVVGHSGIRERVEKAGLIFESLPDRKHFDPTIQRPLAALMLDFTRMAADRQLGDCVVDAARSFRADVVVVDMILTAAIPQIERSGIPTVIFVHCFYQAVRDLAAGPVGWLLRARRVDPLYAEHHGLLQVAGVLPDLDPAQAVPQLVHAGMAWQGVPRAATPAPTPHVLVSLSTNAFAGQRRMLQNILDALAPLPVDVTVTLGPSIDAAGLNVPANASLHAWLNHDDVLAGASLVVGHGGHSTAMRALSFSVPQVIMPANPLIDQKLVGAALARHGAGLALRKHASVKRIRRSVEAVLSDPSFARAADRLGEQIRRRDGAQVAADAISEFAGGRHESART
ncbi:UDP-glucuronosyltransferase [Mycolicibacterium sp. 018/SC-01/001]|uniref:glycosyltransferase n=1 Tax=Mycolicibacterium sp. 018/SC-01/001 TaxID=2592069 RepID=UPI0011807C3F|nr:nucleotide disphospho-sugar-binding domain-containing protein [Mycolicibacterium sp. 018/SC-01/001]TRW81785.1 UDP-glucuronosyltransferase [Mycolicibacterium sp. 018/SC-01/001]